MSASSASTIFFSWFATVIFNLDSKRFQKAKLDTRVEGWTERWGGDDDDEKEERKNVGIEIDNQSVSLLLATPHPQLPIVLTQHRPAWFEQMVLRVSGIPHIVINSKYISNEACGKLPYLTDIDCDRDCEPPSTKQPAILVGRYHPSNLETNTKTGENKILAYLQQYRNVDLDGQASLTTNQQRGLSRCFQYMIDSKLSEILLRLRYDDSDSSWWEQVYCDQYINAASNKFLIGNERQNWLPYVLLGRFQAAMERAVGRKHLLGSMLDKNSRKKLLQEANDAYFAIDLQLKQNETKNDGKNKHTHLLGTDRPALVDVKLWAHLAEAICDVHLVVLLATYPRIVRYFQDMYRTYFETSDGADCDWKKWNEHQNVNNAFQKIPTFGKREIYRSTVFRNVTDLVQKLSLRNDDLVEVLKTVKAKRDKEPIPKQRELSSSILYRWCMGDETLKKDKSPTENQQNPVRLKLMREQVRNDQMWISGIIGVSAVLLLNL